MSDNDTISRKWLLEQYDAQHEGPAGRARKLIEDAPAVPQEMTAREYHNTVKRMLNSDMRAFNMWWDLVRWLDDEDLSFVEKWAREHPEVKTDHPEKRKTYAEDFFEKFPKANRMCEANICLDNARPAVCRADIYRVGNCDGYFTGDCQACWNEEMEENNG